MEWKSLVEIGKRSPYFNHLDMSLLESESGYAKVAMDIKPHHTNINGVVHGGAIASLADQAGMRAIQTHLCEGQAGSTVQMDMHFLTPARSAILVGEGRVKKIGSRLAFCDVEVRDEKGGMVAMARCTVMIAGKNAAS